jgi:hypothetical protein
MTKYKSIVFDDNELDYLMNKDHGLLKYKFDEYGKKWLVENLVSRPTKLQKSAWLALKDVLFLEAQGEPYYLWISKKGIEVRLSKFGRGNLPRSNSPVPEGLGKLITHSDEIEKLNNEY